jgi:protein required for attachment to host cells
MESRTFVLVADGARARLFVTAPENAGLLPALDQEFVGTNLPSRQLGSDRPGRAYNSQGAGRHAMQPPTDPHRYEERAFAREVAAVLDEACDRAAFDNLIVVAPPKALGDLRAEFSDAVRKRITAELPKDLTKIAIHDLPAHLREVL